MEVQATLPTALARFGGAHAPAASWLGRCAAGLLAASAALLVSRRVAGALGRPLSGAAFLGFALAVESLAWGSRLALARGRSSGFAPGGAPSDLLLSASVAALVLAAAVGPPAGWLGGWALAIVGESAAWFLRLRRRRQRPWRAPWLPANWPAAVAGWLTGRADHSLQNQSVAVPPAAVPRAPSMGVDPSFAGQNTVIQSLARHESADGAERLVGRVLLRFVPGQRVATAHVAFCPPFWHLPRVAFEPLEDPAIRVKVGPLYHHGMRLEVKLPAPAEGASLVPVCFSARSPGGSGFSAGEGEG